MRKLIVETADCSRIECQDFEEGEKGIILYKVQSVNQSTNPSGYVPYDNLHTIREVDQ